MRTYTKLGGLEPLKKCKTCIYRSREGTPRNCDYILVTGKRRGCPVEKCEKYKKGRRKHWKDEDTGNELAWGHRER